jgi:Protein of Unknown function (DUF2784)
MFTVLADIILIVHFCYVAYVVLGQVVIFAGMLLKWSWIRNPWFRWSHLAMICIVAAEAIANFRCPLTDWEFDLRRLAGQTGVDQRSFVERLLSDIMFCDCPVDHWGFKVGYISFAVLVIACLWLAPPRRRRQIEKPISSNA